MFPLPWKKYAVMAALPRWYRGDTWKTINNPMACCLLLRHIVQQPGGQVKEMQAHPRNLTHAHREVTPGMS